MGPGSSEERQVKLPPRWSADGPGGTSVRAPVDLTPDERRVIDLLHAEPHGMTLRQLETRLSSSRDGVEPVLESLLERQLVVRLNTLVPSYVYRYRGVDIDIS